jgi:hypothetical protein
MVLAIITLGLLKVLTAALGLWVGLRARCCACRTFVLRFRLDTV